MCEGVGSVRLIHVYVRRASEEGARPEGFPVLHGYGVLQNGGMERGGVVSEGGVGDVLQCHQPISLCT